MICRRQEDANLAFTVSASPPADISGDEGVLGDDLYLLTFFDVEFVPEHATEITNGNAHVFLPCLLGIEPH